jgi:purine-cytosine permease-like protein
MDTTTAPTTDQPFKIEQRGIDIVPLNERHGNPLELFWIWAASLMGIVDLVIGAVVISLGLSLWAAVAAVIIGNISYVLVGLVAMNGPAAGTSTIVISRAAFGRRGNAVPTFFSWLTIVCWEGVNAVVGTLALVGIFSIYGLNGNGYKILSLGIFIALMLAWAILGHATITTVNRLMTYVIGVAMCIVLYYGFQHVNWNYGWSHTLAGTNKFSTFVLAVMIVAAANGLAFTNMPADYSRYLPKKASRKKIALYTALGAFLPATILNGAGAVIGTKLNAFDPVGSLGQVVPHWFHFLFLLIAIVSMIWANIINTYSSGLNLQAMGIRIVRYKTVLIDAVLATGFVCYALWVSNFTTSLENFLALAIWWIAPWTAIYLVDMYLRRYEYVSDDLVRPRGGIYWFSGGVNWSAVAALVIGAGGSVLFTNATLFASPLTTGPLGGADLSIPVGMIVGGSVYYAFNRHLSRAGVPVASAAVTPGATVSAPVASGTVASSAGLAPGPDDDLNAGPAGLV